MNLIEIFNLQEFLLQENWKLIWLFYQILKLKYSQSWIKAETKLTIIRIKSKTSIL